MGETLTNVNPRETTKIKTHHARIVVDGTAEKPYYSIEWYDTTKNEYFLGYSSFYIGNVFKWIEECFEIVEAPKTRAEHIRAMTDEELAEFLMFGLVPIKICDLCENIVASEAACNDNSCRKALMKWLQQPAEVEE